MGSRTSSFRETCLVSIDDAPQRCVPASVDGPDCNRSECTDFYIDMIRLLKGFNEILQLTLAKNNIVAVFYL